MRVFKKMHERGWFDKDHRRDFIRTMALKVLIFLIFSGSSVRLFAPLFSHPFNSSYYSNGFHS